MRPISATIAPAMQATADQIRTTEQQLEILRLRRAKIDDAISALEAARTDQTVELLKKAEAAYLHLALNPIPQPQKVVAIA